MSVRRPSRPSLTLAGIFLLALGVRLLYLAEVRDLPTVRFLLSDSRSYWDWSGRIAAGEWWRGEVFYQAPLYPYFLALVRTVTGDGPGVVRVVQAILGALACVLLARAGTRFVNRATGLVAGILLALNAPAIFFDGLIQKTVLDTFLLAGLLACLASLQPHPRARVWLAGGLLLGLLCLSRENALLLVVVVPLWLFWRFRSSPRAVRLRWATAFALGVVLVLGTAGVRNASVGGGFVITTAQLGPNLYIGNNPRATGSYVPLRPGREDPAHERSDATRLAESELGRPLAPREVSDYWVRRAWEYVRSDPARWLRLTARKFLLTLNATEIADAEDQYAYGARAPLLRGLSWIGHFGIVFPLAVAGIVLTWRSRRDLSILFLVAGALIVAIVPFYVMARYRFPLVLPLLVLAAAGLVRSGEHLGRREWRRLLWPALGLVGAALLAHLPLVSRAQQRIAGLVNMGLAAAQLGRLDEAIRYQDEALQAAPALIQAHYQRGAALQQKGLASEAMASFERVLELDPAHGPALSALGALLLEQGRAAEAVERYRLVTELEPDRAEAWVNLTIALARLGRYPEGIEGCRRAIALDPRHARAYALLGWMRHAQGDSTAAIDDLRRSIELDPALASAHLHLATALAGMAVSESDPRTIERLAEAEEHARRAVALDPTIPNGYEQLVDLLVRPGDERVVLSTLESARGSGRRGGDLYLRAGWGLRRSGRAASAVRVLSEGRRLEPNDANLVNALAWILATARDASVRDPGRAIELGREAVRLGGGRSPHLLDTEAAALAAAGRFAEATETAESAVALARSRGEAELATEIEGRLRGYRDGRAYVED